MLPRIAHSLEEGKGMERLSAIQVPCYNIFFFVVFFFSTEGQVFSFYPHVSTTELAEDAISLINHTETEHCHFYQQVGSNLSENTLKCPPSQIIFHCILKYFILFCILKYFKTPLVCADF